MAVELDIQSAYDGEGAKRITFSDLRDTYKEIVAKAKDDQVASDFFGQIVKRMPRISRLAVERLVKRFGPYLVNSEATSDSSLAALFLGDIASMDTDLEIRIKRRGNEMLNNFGTLAGLDQVRTGKNGDGKFVVKLVYGTSYKPDKIDAYNQYDDEREERTSCSDEFPNKEQALFHGMWLAGALNVRHVDEDDLPK